MALGKTVGELEACLSSAELSEWLAYNLVEPIPNPNWIGGRIASVMASCFGKKQYQPEDFMPQAIKRKASADHRLSPEASVEAMKGMFGGNG